MKLKLNLQVGCRELFPTLQARAYLNHAGVSPLSKHCVEAIERACQGLAQQGAGFVPQQLAERQLCREQLAKLLGCEASQLAFTQSTTASINLLAHSLPLKSGDSIVLFEGEFPTNVIPWLRWAKSRGLNVKWLPAESFRTAHGLEQLESLLRRSSDIRLLAFSAVQFQTGLAMPVASITQLCHRFSCWTFVDLIQAAGVCPVDLRSWQVDFAAGGTHKWLMGPEGLGYLYVAQRHQRALEPNVGGWLSCENAVDFLSSANRMDYHAPFVAAPACFEFSTLNNLSVFALQASLDSLLTLGIEAIQQHVAAYLDILEPQLIQRGFQSLRPLDAAQRGGSLAVQPPHIHAHAHIAKEKLAAYWTDQLGQRSIIVASPDGLLRFSPHWPNSTEEIALVMESVDEVLRS